MRGTPDASSFVVHGEARSSRKRARKLDAIPSHPKAPRPDDANAFLPDPEQGPAVAPDDLAEKLAEEFVEAATSAEETNEEVSDELLPEELGGPFVATRASEELDRAPDASNPPDAEREPFPRAVRVPYK